MQGLLLRVQLLQCKLSRMKTGLFYLFFVLLLAVTDVVAQEVSPVQQVPCNRSLGSSQVPKEGDQERIPCRPRPSNDSDFRMVSSASVIGGVNASNNTCGVRTAIEFLEHAYFLKTGEHIVLSAEHLALAALISLAVKSISDDAHPPLAEDFTRLDILDALDFLSGAVGMSTADAFSAKIPLREWSQSSELFKEVHDKISVTRKSLGLKPGDRVSDEVFQKNAGDWFYEINVIAAKYVGDFPETFIFHGKNMTSVEFGKHVLQTVGPQEYLIEKGVPARKSTGLQKVRTVDAEKQLELIIKNVELGNAVPIYFYTLADPAQKNLLQDSAAVLPDPVSAKKISHAEVVIGVRYLRGKPTHLQLNSGEVSIHYLEKYLSASLVPLR
jgi:hypothetical protein